MDNENSGKEERIRILNENEKQMLFSSISDSRDFILVKILYETGCTLQAVCKIKVDDFEFIKCKVKIFLNESNILGRECFLSTKLCSEVKLYIKKMKMKDDDYLFSTRQSESMTPKRVSQIIEYYLNRIGVHDKTGKCIRYTHIVDAYKNKVSIEQIEKQVGIKKPRLVQICGSVKTDNNAYDNFF